MSEQNPFNQEEANENISNMLKGFKFRPFPKRKSKNKRAVMRFVAGTHL